MMKQICSAIILITCLCLLPNFQANAGQRSKTKPPQGSKHQSNVSPSIEYIRTQRARPTAFSEVVRVDHMLYLSGQIGVDESGKLVTGGIKAETKQVLENIQRILERNGSGMNRVVKCTVMLTDIADREAMNEIYTTFFPQENLPARSTFATNGLALGAHIEIECMAVRK